MEQEQDYSGLLVGMLVPAAIMLFCAFSSVRRKKKIKRKLSEARKTEQVPQNIIILAFEIVNLILLFSTQSRRGFKALRTNQGLLARLSNLLSNRQPCFFPRFSRRAIRTFFGRLKTVENLKLVLYTSLCQAESLEILRDLNLEGIFQERDRIYSKIGFKPASEVDHDTRRVIIVTANPQDQDRDITSYHTLLLELGKDPHLDDSLLENLLNCLLRLAEQGRHDSMHENMHQLTHSQGLPLPPDEP